MHVVEIIKIESKSNQSPNFVYVGPHGRHVATSRMNSVEAVFTGIYFLFEDVRSKC